MTLRLSLLLVVAPSLLAALGCSAGSGGSSTTMHAGSGGTPGGSGGTASLITDQGMRDPLDTRDLPVRQKVCDASGMNCTCLRLAMLGTLASAAVDTDSQAFVTWLNDHSNSTATVTSVPVKPTVDAAFLAQYDILLVANVNSWLFSADEKAAIQKWVTETGGGIITLTGFSSMPAERDTSSQVISFSGLNYGTAGDSTPPAAPAIGQEYPVYYKGGTTNLRQCLFWNNSVSTTHSSPFITTPLKFMPQTGEASTVSTLVRWASTYSSCSADCSSAPNGLSRSRAARSPVARRFIASSCVCRTASSGRAHEGATVTEQ